VELRGTPEPPVPVALPAILVRPEQADRPVTPGHPAPVDPPATPVRREQVDPPVTPVRPGRVGQDTLACQERAVRGCQEVRADRLVSAVPQVALGGITARPTSRRHRAL